MGNSIVITGAEWEYPIAISKHTLSGIVTDGTNPISGVLVSCGSYSMTTSGDGSYSFNLEAGNYTLKTTKSGYLADDVSVVISDSNVEKNVAMMSIDDYAMNLAELHFHAQHQLGHTASVVQYTPTTTANRCCIIPMPLSVFAGLGYTNITFSFKSGVDVILAVGTESTEYSSDALVDFKMYNSTGGETTWAWQQSASLKGVFSVGQSLAIHFKKSDDSDFASSVGFEDLVDSVELS